MKSIDKEPRPEGLSGTVRRTAVIINGFVHDFAAGIWLAAIATIAILHRAHGAHPEVTAVLNLLERQFFWISLGAAVAIMATGAGRTFTYVDNWYGAGAEAVRRRLLIIKHVILLAGFGMGYWLVYGMVFHP
jgi:uncharacterized membrane protein